MIQKKDELLEEVSVIQYDVKRYNFCRDTYQCYTMQFEMMKSMSGKGDNISPPEMVLALKLTERHVSILINALHTHSYSY